MINNRITVIGAGLAGCEAANQIAKMGIKVDLYEMKPNKMTPAHSMKDMFAELVCSNSLKAARESGQVPHGGDRCHCCDDRLRHGNRQA